MNLLEERLFISSRHPELWRNNPGLSGDSLCDDSLELISEDLRDEFTEFQRDCHSLWASPTLATARSARVVDLVRVDAVQVDSKESGRVLLRDEVQALCDLPGCGEFFHEALAAAPDRKVLRVQGFPFRGSFRMESEGNQAVAQVWVTDPGAWPEVLGGEWAPGEAARRVRATVRFAKWRDRRALRLTRVEVLSKFVVPK